MKNPDAPAELPSEFYGADRDLQTLQTGIDLYAVPNGMYLWMRVVKQATDFTRQEVADIYTMLGRPAPDFTD